jgi:hypothetical protein
MKGDTNRVMTKPAHLSVFLMALFLLAACLARPVVKREDGPVHQQQNRVILDAVLQSARSGDWLVIRGYHTTDHLVANATGIPISHVGVYDAVSRTVVEAEGQGVQRTSIEAFVDKSFRLLVIRPRWSTPETSAAAAANAGALVGRSYDFLGTIGFSSSRRYYCSELAVTVYKRWHELSEVFPRVIKPGELYLYGAILYDSKPRSEW